MSFGLKPQVLGEALLFTNNVYALKNYSVAIQKVFVAPGGSPIKDNGLGSQLCFHLFCSWIRAGISLFGLCALFLYIGNLLGLERTTSQGADILLMQVAISEVLVLCFDINCVASWRLIIPIIKSSDFPCFMLSFLHWFISLLYLLMPCPPFFLEDSSYIDIHKLCPYLLLFSDASNILLLGNNCLDTK